MEMMGQGMRVMATGGPGTAMILRAMILRMGEALDLTVERSWWAMSEAGIWANPYTREAM